MNLAMTPEGRRKRFEAIAVEVLEPLQRYLRRRANLSDTEDLLADVMLTVWRRLDDAPTDHLLPWCYGIARRVLANQRRSHNRRLRLVQRIQAEPPPRFEGNPAETGLDPELDEALASLGEDDREILRLWAWEQLEPREIGPVLQISVNAATLRLSRAKKKLARQLSRQNSAGAGHIAVEGT